MMPPMRLKSTLRRFASNRGLVLEKASASPELKDFIARFRHNFVSCDLIRVGGEGDGGYLVPDILSEVAFCLSPGVGGTANFEKDLSSNYGIASFMTDGSVGGLPVQDERFSFLKKSLGSKSEGDSITLNDWITTCVGDQTKRGLLQMDIEGDEYGVLAYEDADTLARFVVLVIEFHYLERIFDLAFLKCVSAIFDKIYKNFCICHAHVNNCCGIQSLGGVEVPRTMEVTFVRVDLLPRVANDGSVRLPHPLDSKNVSGRGEILLPEDWWR